ncbi:MAG: hypothetical protein COB17_00875 [Sulfurimonas sp.]|nr:MAG: hypothetical protein COB17_00875 [Sulfurimonas sp.]
MKFSDLEEYGDLSGTVYEGNMDISNKGLTSLEGMPKEIIGSLICYGNNLKTLEGMPQKIGSYCLVPRNQLTSLKGIAQIISGDFYCGENKLTSLDYLPKMIQGTFTCYGNTNVYLQEEFFFILKNQGIPKHIFKIKMYLKTNSEYYLTPKEYKYYFEKYPEHFV